MFISPFRLANDLHIPLPTSALSLSNLLRRASRMPLEGHQSTHTRPIVPGVPVDTALLHTHKNMLQETDTHDTSEAEDDDQDLETATFLGSIWNLFKDTKELSQELLKDTKELATRELDTLLDRLPFGQAKTKESEDTTASSDDSRTDSSQQQRQQQRRQPLRKYPTLLGNQTHGSSVLDAPVLPLKKTGKLSRESSVSRTREPGLYGKKKDLEVIKTPRETMEMSSSTHIGAAEDKSFFTNAATTADHLLDYSFLHTSGARYPASQELPPSPTLRIQRNTSFRNLSHTDKPPVEDALSLGLKSIYTSALVVTSSPSLPILSTVTLTRPPPSSSLSPSPPVLPSQEAEDKLATVLKELADMKQQVQGFQALREQVNQIEALKDQVKTSPQFNWWLHTPEIRRLIRQVIFYFAL